MNAKLTAWFLRQTAFLQVVVLTAVIGVTFTGIGYTAYQSMAFDANGNLKIVVYSGSSPVTPSATATEAATFATGATNQLQTLAYSFWYNGTNWVRMALGQATMANSLPVTLASNQSTIATQNVGGTTGGSTPCVLQSAATTNATSCKASAGTVYGYRVINTTATLYYLRMYNLAAAPTCSSATGFVETIPIAASTAGAGISYANAIGEAYGTGVAFCLTGGGSSTDNTSAATGVYVSILYK